MITSYHTSTYFTHVTKFTKQEKMCTIFYLCQLYFAIKKASYTKHTGYDFFILNILRLKNDRRKSEN